MEPFIGQVMMFGGNFAPRGWALCDGQLLSINSNSALFSILGTTYGGDGRTTFALPDLRGRVAIGPRTGPGLSNYNLGQSGGVEAVTLTTAQIPAHSHDLEVQHPVTEGTTAYAGAEEDNTQATGTEVTNSTGGGQSHENRQPYLVVNYIIALQGTYPSRS